MTAFNDQSIVAYIHCSLCIDEWKADAPGSEGVTPREWAQLEVGWTQQGFQVWCKRHECNVLHVDFQGQKHPADTTRIEPARV